MNQTGILVIGVIYNTYPETLRYLASLSTAATHDISLILVDNSDQVKPADFMEKIKNYPFLQYLETRKNLGYFHGALEGLNYYLAEYPSFPRWILVTNVDIVFTPQFFVRLMELPDQPNLGLVAPAIISKKWNTDYNPEILVRYSKTRLIFYRFLYSCFLIHNLFLIASYGKKWVHGMLHGITIRKNDPTPAGMKIYAAHGSCLVFSASYFNRGGTLDLPIFLFGEEIFIAEAAMQSGLNIVYRPELVIYDAEHASTGFFVTPALNVFYRQAIRAILDRYYR